MKIQCQRCGAEEVSSYCNNCGYNLDRQTRVALRADKRFELVKAWGPAFYDVDLGVINVEMVLAAADDALTALYGPEPGKDEL